MKQRLEGNELGEVFESRDFTVCEVSPKTFERVWEIILWRNAVLVIYCRIKYP